MKFKQFYMYIKKNVLFISMTKTKTQFFYTITILSLFLATLYFLHVKTRKMDMRSNNIIERANDNDDVIAENVERIEKTKEEEEDKKQWKDNDKQKDFDSINDKSPQENINSFMSLMNNLNAEDIRKYIPMRYSQPNLVALPGKFNSGFDDPNKENINEDRFDFYSKQLKNQFPDYLMNNQKTFENNSLEANANTNTGLEKMTKSFEEIEKQQKKII